MLMDYSNQQSSEDDIDVAWSSAYGLSPISLAGRASLLDRPDPAIDDVPPNALLATRVSVDQSMAEHLGTAIAEEVTDSGYAGSMGMPIEFSAGSADSAAGIASSSMSPGEWLGPSTDA